MIPCLRFALKQAGRKTELDGSADEMRPFQRETAAGNVMEVCHSVFATVLVTVPKQSAFSSI